ncbi:eukaryotic translation initiation factor 3 subunit A, partial [Austrofundulus limnaeus]|uniref:Eukaryotic translation initiation factor 3 subunit A n=1 Tax=Austrofundulus limnaeus TaxID=52670 RepID=A0A2I4AK05_AUSLI
MTEPGDFSVEPEVSPDPQLQFEDQATVSNEQQEQTQLRRSQRVKTLTEKGREMQEERIQGLQQRFNYNYEKWRTRAKSSKQPLSQSDTLSDDLLKDIIGDVTGLRADVTKVYEELRKLAPPDQVTRRRVDLCVEISNFIVKKAKDQLDRKSEEEQDWPDAGSLFQTTNSKVSFFNTSGKTSEHSSSSSVKHQEAAAEAAASRAVLIVLEEQEREQQEIAILEAEVRKKAVEHEALVKQMLLEREAEEIKLRMQREADEVKLKAQQEEEYAKLQRMLEEKKRKIQHLDKVKDLKAAQARMQVYDQTSVNELHKVDVTNINTEVKGDTHVSFPSLPEQVSPQAIATPTNDGTSDLVKVLASALSASRIPVPEPAVFSGDPIRYSDWKHSFETLIDQKSIPDKEKIFYLRRYLSGQAKS